MSGLFRKTSRAFERCFSALAATIVMIILSALFDMSHRWGVPRVLRGVCHKGAKARFFFGVFLFSKSRVVLVFFVCRWNLEMLASVSFAFILPGAQSVLLYQFVL